MSVLNQIIPHLMEYLGSETPYDVYATDGKSTKGFRIAKNVPKEHYTDAYCIACSIWMRIRRSPHLPNLLS